MSLSTLFRRALLCGLLLAAGAAQADGATRYLDDARLHQLQAVLAPPSVPGSPEDRADRAVTDQAYANRSAADAALSHQEESFDVFGFARVLGPGFDATKLPRTAALFTEVQKETAKAVKEAKNHWERERPCPLDSCRKDAEGDEKDSKKKSFSYPSGHSTRATVFAILLARALPSRSDALAGYALDVGWRRVVRGVHTPQDIYAGRVFGQALATAFLANPALRHDLDEAAKELTAAGFAAPAKAAAAP